MDPLEFTPNSFDFNKIFRRACVECPDTALRCPTCADNEVCIQISPTCDQCGSRKCVPASQSGANNGGPNPSGDSSPNIGAIVGGVVAGIVFIAALTFCIWWFIIRKRRQQWEEEIEQEIEERRSSPRTGPTSPRDPFPPTQFTPSQRTRSIATRSVANSTFSSHTIQVAFVPGVMDRGAVGGYTPPVPPIPAQPQSPFTDSSGDHYFMPGDLRDSTYSGFTDDGTSTIGRGSMARSIAPSIAPSLLRESVASHVYHDDSIANPMPAQTALRGRANVVSVHKGSAMPSRGGTPAVPVLDQSKFGTAAAAASSNDAVTSSLNTRVMSGPPVIPSIYVTEDSSTGLAGDMWSDTISVHSGVPDLESAIEEATRKASEQPTHGGLGSVKTSTDSTADPSPFSDAHRMSEASSSAGTDEGFSGS